MSMLIIPILANFVLCSLAVCTPVRLRFQDFQDIAGTRRKKHNNGFPAEEVRVVQQHLISLKLEGLSMKCVIKAPVSKETSTARGITNNQQPPFPAVHVHELQCQFGDVRQSWLCLLLF